MQFLQQIQYVYIQIFISRLVYLIHTTFKKCGYTAEKVLMRGNDVVL